MQQLLNPSTNPYYNLALEEYVLRNMDADYFLLWQNRPAIIVGRNQNTIEEIDQQYVQEHDIAVVRRQTGGGAVYHDLGNLNFTFVVEDRGGLGFDFARYTRPIIAALARIGVTAEHSGRNDITIEGKKFSGNAQYRFRNRLIHHGTLLFASDLTVLRSALTVKPHKIVSKGVKSVQSRVTNIKDYVKEDLSIGQFADLVAESIREEYGISSPPRDLTPREKQEVEQLVADKYGTWAWNYGSSPAYDIQHSAHFDWGEVDIRLQIKKGMIAAVKIFGDFFNHQEISELESALAGTPYHPEALEQRIREINITRYLPQMEEGVFLKLMME